MTVKHIWLFFNTFGPSYKEVEREIVDHNSSIRIEMWEENNTFGSHFLKHQSEACTMKLAIIF